MAATGEFDGWGPSERKVKGPHLPKLERIVLEEMSFQVTSDSCSLFIIVTLVTACIINSPKIKS